MRTQQLILAGSGLVILFCALLIFRPHDRAVNGVAKAAVGWLSPTTAAESESPVESRSAVTATSTRPHRSKLPIQQHSPEPSVNRTASADSVVAVPKHQVTANSNGGDTLPSSKFLPAPTPSLPKGIQLADNVKLPAVIFAISTAEKNPDRRIPAPVAAAMHGIVDSFYRDLMEGAAAANVGATSAASNATTDTGDTLVIHPGSAVDRARERANQTYRALFGDAAYNQVTMKAVIDVQLPTGVVTESE